MLTGVVCTRRRTLEVMSSAEGSIQTRCIACWSWNRCSFIRERAPNGHRAAQSSTSSSSPHLQPSLCHHPPSLLTTISLSKPPCLCCPCPLPPMLMGSQVRCEGAFQG